MKNTITNKLKMYQAVSRVCEDHQLVWDQTPAFVEAYNAFTEKVSLLNEQSMIQMAALTGITEHKKEVLNSVIEKALVIGKALGALALTTGDTELLARNLIAKTEWFRGNTHLRVNRLKILKLDYTTHAMALLDYGIDQVFLGEMSALISDYTDISVSPRQAILSRKSATDTMDALIYEIDGLLKGQLSFIVEVFKSENPGFVRDFYSARVIVDLKGKRRSSGKSLDELDESTGVEQEGDKPEIDDGDGLPEE